MNTLTVLSLWLFWGCGALILYTYVGFPLILILRGLLFSRPIKAGNDTPTVSLIIAAYNEELFITERLKNISTIDYPKSRLEIIIASDGSDDETEARVQEFDSCEIRLLKLPRQGKNRTLNSAVANATGDILVFSDVDSLFTRNALRNLVAPFTDPEVGGVVGDFRYTDQISEGDGERAYWNFDRMLKRFQSLAGSVTSATGQIYAVRREHFKPIPEGVIDDFYTSTQVPAVHCRLIFESRAVAYGPTADSVDVEFHRKVRVATSGLRSVLKMRRLLNPIAFGFYAIQLITHKILRRFMVVPLLLLALTTSIVWEVGLIYQIAGIGQLAFHGLAFTGFLLRGTQLGRLKVFGLPYFFDMVNFACMIAILNVIRGTNYDIWTPPRPERTACSVKTNR